MCIWLKELMFNSEMPDLCVAIGYKYPVRHECAVWIGVIKADYDVVFINQMCNGVLFVGITDDEELTVWLYCFHGGGVFYCQ